VSTTFLLVRHAAHDWLGRGFAGRLPDVVLNEAGRRQAQELATRLAGERLDAIYCSPQQRTQKTAQPVAAQLGLTLRIEAAFDEVDLGDWTGRTFEEVRDQAAWQHWLERRSTAQPPGGEPFAQVAQRAMAGLRRLLREHPEQQLLVVSHGDVLKAMIASCLGLSLDLLERFDLAPASISILVMGEDWTQLRLLNAQGPLR
jgi:broad specificity phosphatase PhoE